MADTDNTYETLLRLVKTRTSIRKFRPDPIPIGYPDVPARDGVRRPLTEMVHRERYGMSKYMSNEDVIRYLYSLREATVPVHPSSCGVKAEEK